MDMESKAELAIRLIERASFTVPQCAMRIREDKMLDEHKFNAAIQACDAMMFFCENQWPDEQWAKDYFTLTGEHMVLIEDSGWVPAHMNSIEHTGYPAQEVLDEVNAPALVEA